MDIEKRNKILKNVIIAISVLIPIVVFALYYLVPNKENFDVDVSFLPKINAGINFLVSCLLVLGLYFIKNGDNTKHQASMVSALGLSALFLVSYVVYHFLSESTKFGGEGLIKTIYLFILLTHIVFAAIILPFVLFSFYYSLTEQFEKHKKLSRITWPMWFYVSVSGVAVYLLISPYY